MPFTQFLIRNMRNDEKLLRKRSYCLTASLSIIQPAKSLELTVFLPVVCTAVGARQAGSTSSGDRESSFLHRDFIALIWAVMLSTGETRSKTHWSKLHDLE